MILFVELAQCDQDENPRRLERLAEAIGDLGLARETGASRAAWCAAGIRNTFKSKGN